MDPFGLADSLGPSKIVHVHEPALELRAVLVVDNVARGPSIGGVRMAANVSTEECFRLARAMTLKNAAAGLPHGGGKSVLFGDPRMPIPRKQQLIRAFTHALRTEQDYIFGPDMGTDETCMAWIKDEIGRAVGLPADLGGIPLDEVGATGWGLYHAAVAAAPVCGIDLRGARVAIQGFGAVGRHAARFLADAGAILVAACDTSGTLADAAGLDVNALIELKRNGARFADHRAGRLLPPDAIIDVDCDVWIPAARPDVIRDDNVHRLQARLVLEGANIPIVASAERTLHDRGVWVVPDFIANAGGVICAAMELQAAGQSRAFEVIRDKIASNTTETLSLARARACTPRAAATEMAVARVRRAMATRRFCTGCVTRAAFVRWGTIARSGSYRLQANCSTIRSTDISSPENSEARQRQAENHEWCKLATCSSSVRPDAIFTTSTCFFATGRSIA
jgi:glutamate dehydrogenase (NAD(P)+)